MPLLLMLLPLQRQHWKVKCKRCRSSLPRQPATRPCLSSAAPCCSSSCWCGHTLLHCVPGLADQLQAAGAELTAMKLQVAPAALAVTQR